jgi:hypothetical protein
MVPALSSICEDDEFVCELPPPPWSCIPDRDVRNPFSGTLDCDEDADLVIDYECMFFSRVSGVSGADVVDTNPR